MKKSKEFYYIVGCSLGDAVCFIKKYKKKYKYILNLIAKDYSFVKRFNDCMNMNFGIDNRIKIEFNKQTASIIRMLTRVAKKIVEVSNENI
jgi:hypothetical protein